MSAHHANTKGPKGEDIQVPVGLWIDGQLVSSSQNRTFETISAANGKTLATLQEGNDADVNKAVIAAQKAFPKWRETHGSERGRLMNKLADLIEERLPQLAIVSSLDTGMLVSAAGGFDLPSLIELLRYYAGAADKIQGKTIQGKKTLNYTLREPHGVCGLILPWNFPNLILGWKLGPALAAGNTVVIKPSEITSLTTLCVAELSKQAGFPDGVINVVTGHGAVAKSNLKHVSLELGGKGAVIVAEDADVEKAALWSCLGIYFHQGQVCAAGSRIFVHESIKVKFLEAFQRNIDEAKYGDPLQSQDIADIVGPVASSQQREKVASMVQAGKDAGFEWWEGQKGTKPPHENYLPRGYFLNPDPEHDVAAKEIFGPVACISTFSSLAQAVEMANATEYGLSANVFSRNIDTALSLATQIEAGTVWVNCTAMLDAATPFGGVKQSGNGRDGGDEALDLYLSTKTVKIMLEPLPGRL